MSNIKPILDHLPYKVAAYDAKGHVLYHNNGADGSFLPSPAEDLPSWLMTDLLASTDKTLSYQVPTDSFDQILIQTYQATCDDNGQVLGIWETIFDLKAPLQAYLDNTAQVLVGWSDATSGPSIQERE